MRDNSHSSSQERNQLQYSEINQVQSSQSPTRNNQQFKTSTLSSIGSQNLTKIDLSKGALDSRIILAQNGLNQQPFLLETISSNESRFTSSPNFLARSKESFNPTHFGNVAQSIQFNQEMNSLGNTQQNMNNHMRNGIVNGQQTQIINVPTLRHFNQYESISYSASSEFGQHSLRSSVEQQNSTRGFQHLADQIRLEQYQVKNYQNPLTILEESKEEDVSFNKTITDQSPIPMRQKDGTITGGVIGIGTGPYGNNFTGTGGVYFDNKSSIDDGTRSLLMHMKGVPGLDSQDHSGTLGSQALRNTSILGGGGIAGNARPNFNISSSSNINNGQNFMKFVNATATPQKSSTQLLNGQKFNGKMEDQELLHELGQKGIYDPKASTQQQVISSLQISDDKNSTLEKHMKSDNEDFNVIDEIGSARQNSQNTAQNSEVKQQYRSQERLQQSQLMQSAIGQQQHYRNDNYHTFKGQQQQVKNDPIRIDDNQFVTLNQIPEESGYYGSRNNNQQFYSGRPSNLSQYGQYVNQNLLGGGTFSDGQSSSDLTSAMTTPYQNQRMISPYPFTRREISGSQMSQKCQCCQAPLQGANHNRPLSGLSQIETKDMNYYDKNAENEVQTPQLASDVDQSTKILSNKNGISTDQVSSYKAVLCLECQSKILNNNSTPLGQFDLKASQLTTSNIMVKSQIQNFDELQINSNLSSIHRQNNLASSSNQFLSQNNPSQINNHKFASSLMGQSELQQSYLTQSNNNNNNNENNQHLINNNTFNNIQQSQLSSNLHQYSQPLQVNNLLMNSDSMHNPQLQSSSLHYLSYLSQNLGSQLKSSDEQLTQKYGLNTQDNYKVALKSFMNRQFERSARQGAYGNENGGSIQYSRIFRERQSRRVFDQLQNIKGEYCKTYEELEAMHTGLLLGNINNIK